MSKYGDRTRVLRLEPKGGSQVGGAFVAVWDLPVRLFHWFLVASVATAAVTGFLAPEWWLGVHSWTGYAIGALLILRCVWGFWGPTYARFSSFVFSPRTALNYVSQLLAGRNHHYVGHNPAGSLMIFGLFGVLGALVVTGLIVLGGQENRGVVAGFISYRSGHAIAAVHEFLAVVLLFMIGGHLAGLIAESILSGDNLAGSMITGRKFASKAVVMARDRRPRPGVALLAVSVIILAGGYATLTLNRVPASGLVARAPHAAWAKECGDCHHAYHPSLLPAKSWRGIMAGLPDHFGEDASLDPAMAASITNHLTGYAAEIWDTEAANNLRRLDRKDPLRITATRYWTHRHSAIEKSVFTRKSIGSKGNCIACHRDAASGRFDDEMIEIPDVKTPLP